MHFSGCGIAASAALLVYLSSLFSKSRRNDLRRIMSPSLETDAIFDAALSVNSHMVVVWVSAMAVTLVCDEKRAEVHADPRRPGRSVFTISM